MVKTGSRCRSLDQRKHLKDGGEGGITRPCGARPSGRTRYARAFCAAAPLVEPGHLNIEDSNPACTINRKRGARPLFLLMAEREGFEPSVFPYVSIR